MSTLALANAAAPSVRRGILWMLLCSVFFVSLDATAKYLTHSYPVFEITWARYLFHSIFGLLWAGSRLPVLLRGARYGMQLARGLLLAVTTALYFLAVRTIPLADAVSIGFMAPILVTALSVPLLGEHVGARRWTGVVIGFAGALIIVRPGASVFEVGAALVLASAAINALYQIMTRILSRTDRPMTTNVYSALVGTAAAALGLPLGWITPDLEGWLLMMFAGFCGVVGHYALLKAFEAAPPSALAPFSYFGLFWSTIYGYVLFGDFPDRWTIVGALIISCSGLYVFYRGEAVRRRASALSPTTRNPSPVP
jgi:drug/metabolite transporter (DMT)-like permease